MLWPRSSQDSEDPNLVNSELTFFIKFIIFNFRKTIFLNFPFFSYCHQSQNSWKEILPSLFTSTTFINSSTSSYFNSWLSSFAIAINSFLSTNPDLSLSKLSKTSLIATLLSLIFLQKKYNSNLKITLQNWRKKVNESNVVNNKNKT